MDKDFGYVEYNGLEIKLSQQPYLDFKVLNEDFFNGYFSTGSDNNGNDYEIFWEITNKDCEDESDACDWSDFEVRKL